jgi:1-acyl-sn-glycerol-3-phosphate acyltransferase
MAQVGGFRSVVRSVKLAGYFVRFGSELLVTRPQTRPERAAWLHRFCRTALLGLGLELTVEGKFPERGAVISNHLSYIDIIVFAAIRPCVFCSKAEIEKVPILGWMTTMAGTIYVERGRGGSALKARGEMQAAAEAGLPVVFFPEGTTTNGRGLLPFHSGLLAQAMGVEEPITAAFLHYTLDRENAPGIKAEDDMCWWGARSMWAHIFRFLGLDGPHATVRFGQQPLRFSSDVLHRKAAAVEAREAVLRLGGLSGAGPDSGQDSGQEAEQDELQLADLDRRS